MFIISSSLIGFSMHSLITKIKIVDSIISFYKLREVTVNVLISYIKGDRFKSMIQPSLIFILLVMCSILFFGMKISELDKLMPIR